MEETNKTEQNNEIETLKQEIETLKSKIETFENDKEKLNKELEKTKIERDLAHKMIMNKETTKPQQERTFETLRGDIK